MTLKNNNELRNKIVRLQQCLVDAGFTLPLFVRFRTNKKSLMLAVSKLIVNETSLQIFNGESVVIPINWNNLIGVEALCDANKKPIFFNNLNDIGEVDLNK